MPLSPAEAHGLAPAKVNLYLRVVGRRQDGYHLLDSLMLPVSLYDSVHVRVQPLPHTPVRISLACDAATIPTGPANLAWKAAELFAAQLHEPVAVDITLEKRIPAGSGLGGGSSDAAAVLLLLNRLCRTPLSRPQLADLGAHLGADVPFFVVGRPARVGGIGEQIDPVPDMPVLHLVLCSDGFEMSTAAVYSAARRSLTKLPSNSSIQSFVSGQKPITEWLVNDLEAAAAEIHPGVLRLKSKLVELGAVGALMTGSGAAVFGIWPEAESVREAARRLCDDGLWAEAVRTLATSPMAEA
jgi:4-diphosphocytidyl-2-C-methyl-D-erythritol kinase